MVLSSSHTDITADFSTKASRNILISLLQVITGGHYDVDMVLSSSHTDITADFSTKASRNILISLL